MKILVTGGAGFIGSNLSEALVKEGHDIVVLDNFSLGNMKNLQSVKNQVKIIKGDITDYKTVLKAGKGCDIIFNQAAASSSPMFRKELRRSISVNIDSFVNVMNAAKENSVPKVIYASTSSIYGNNPSPLKEDMKCGPVNMYASTKLMNEHIAFLFENGIQTIGLRYMSIYGPREEPKGMLANLVSQFLWAMQKGESPVIYGDGKQTRDFTYVKDVVRANMLAMNAKCTGIFNVGTGKETSLNSLAQTINKILGKSIMPLYVKNDVKNYIEAQRADTSKAKKNLGFKAEFSLESGIRNMLS